MRETAGPQASIKIDPNGGWDRDQAVTNIQRLSRFDLDPTRVGQPLRVEGDVVWETQLAILVSIPYFANAAGLVFRRQRRVVSTVPAAVYARLIAGGGR